MLAARPRSPHETHPACGGSSSRTDGNSSSGGGRSSSSSAAANGGRLVSSMADNAAAACDGVVLQSFDLAGVAALIREGSARRIVVMAGAGISVSAGLPDFRSPGSGLYSRLQHLDLPWPEAAFNLAFFRHNPKPFCVLAKELWPARHKHAPTPTHHFLRLLADKGLLLSVFTQNIDSLEALAGVPADRVVHAHGSFDGAHCIDCGQTCSVYAVQAAVFDDDVPTCDSCGGFVKPDVTFFGERLPGRFHRRRLADMPQADLLLVLGTSLAVQPFAGMIDQVPADTPRVLINLNRVGEKQQRQKQAACGCCAAGRSTNSSSSSEDGECGPADGGSSAASGGTSPALTASNSAAGVSSCSCGTVAQPDGTGPAAVHNEPPTTSSADSGGFDFRARRRDVLYLGDCDAAVMQLAQLLGWEEELQALVAAGQAALREARELCR